MLKKLSIKGLYGLYDYMLDFCAVNRNQVTFVTAPNGFGKTTILDMVDALYNKKFEVFFDMTFLSLEFVIDGVKVLVEQSRQSVMSMNSDDNGNDGLYLNVYFATEDKDYDRNMSYQISMEDLNNSDSAFRDVYSALDLYFDSEKCVYLDDRRLLKENSNDSKLLKYAGEMSDILREEDSRLMERFVRLVSKQVNKMLKMDAPNSIDEEKLTEARGVLKAYWQYGLLRKISFEISDDSNPFEVMARVEAMILMREESDMQLKLLKVFRTIIERSSFVNKRFELNLEQGFKFIATNADETKIEFSRLSSGEQHILIQAYSLLFKAKEKSLTLVDEPEMSFHLAWQGDYYRNLMDIVKLRNIQCIIATHSPHVFNSDWDISLDLYDLSHPEEEE